MEWTSLFIAIGIIVVPLLVVVLMTYGITNERLRGIERKLNALLRHHGVDPTKGLPLSERVKELAADPRQKINAIKAYREETGSSLIEAKDAIEWFIQSQ